MSIARQQVVLELHDRGCFAWTEQQALMLRSGKLTGVDTQHLAEEIEDLGRTIMTQRKDVNYDLVGSLSLKPLLNDPEWLDLVWPKATDVASNETGINLFMFPEDLPWSMADVMRDGWLPE